MYSKDNCRLQAKIDISSYEFIKTMSKSFSMSIAELSGAIIRKFIYDFSSGSDEYKKLDKYVIRDGKLKEFSK